MALACGLATHALQPAHGESESRKLEAEEKAFEIRGKALAEIEQLEKTIEILTEGGAPALQAYLIDNFEAFIEPFAKTVELFPAEDVSIISGAGGELSPISAIDPHPVVREKSDLIHAAFEKQTGGKTVG